jgi:hypothetical protein
MKKILVFLFVLLWGLGAIGSDQANAALNWRIEDVDAPPPCQDSCRMI